MTALLNNPPIVNDVTQFYGNVNTLVTASSLIGPTNVSSVMEPNPKMLTLYGMSLGIQRDIGFHTVLDVAYVGSGVLASALCMDKILFKDVMARAGLPQVGYWSLDLEAGVNSIPPAPGVTFPCWVKPARLGSSGGMSSSEK